MSQPAQTIPVNVHLPDSLGLNDKQVRVLEEKWQKDLSDAVSENSSHAKFHISIKVTITITAHN
jgi:hypothetical protein